MGLREDTLALNALSIATVAELLGFRLPARGMARCPFPDHRDSKPSFEVRGDGRRWICYSCDRRGGAIDLVMMIRGLDFPDARRWLAQRSGMETGSRRKDADRPVPQFVTANRQTEQDRLETPPDSALYAAYVARSPLLGSGLQYLRRRGLQDAIIERFAIGQAPGIEPIRALMKQFGFERLRSAGLLIQAATPERPIPIFPAGSLIFPYFEAGSIAYIQARLIVDRVDGSRWRNLNYRRRRLYNVDVLTRPGVRRIAICEGAVDVLSATQLGWEAIGLIGVSAQLTEEQIISLRSRQIDILLDWDVAGETRAGRLRLDLARYGVASTRKSRPSPTSGDVNDYLREGRSTS